MLFRSIAGAKGQSKAEPKEESRKKGGTKIITTHKDETSDTDGKANVKAEKAAAEP